MGHKFSEDNHPLLVQVGKRGNEGDNNRFSNSSSGDATRDCNRRGKKV
jgi:hypothetical protein